MVRRSLMLFLLLMPVVALCQTYSFTVDKNYSAVYINSDGTCTISYEIQFTCDSHADAIDIVDIGMPNEWYDLNSASASIDGYELKTVRRSEYVHPGVEIPLSPRDIDPGETGTLVFSINVQYMIYPDDEDDEYASLKFSPTWYGSEFTHGTTELLVYFIFPPGMGPDEPRYHETKFSDAAVDSSGRVWYLYKRPHASPSSQCIYGVSFPKKYVPDDAIVTETPHRFSFGEAIGSFFAGLISLITGSCPCVIIGFFIFIIVIGAIKASKRKMKYLPPALSIEGVGIKRGLTAVESAILLELPLNKVATMILFGLIKKRALKVKKEDPLLLEITEGEKPQLHEYEKDFLKGIGSNGAIVPKTMRSTFVNLIKAVNKKTKGFSRSKTRAYYRSILNRAWTEIRDANTPELKSKVFDKNLEWLLMDDDYKSKMTDTFGDSTIVAPLWWGHYRPGFAGHPAGGGAAAPSAGLRAPSISMPTLPGANFANSIVSGIEGFANKLVGNLSGFQTAVTKVTNPPPVSSRSGGWSSSGGGCACACACAGCACACAGGGR